MYGKVFKAARKRANLKQEELAFQLHINQSDISKIENDQKEMPFSLAMKWAQLTQSQEIIALMIVGVDASQVLADLLSTPLNIISWFLL